MYQRFTAKSIKVNEAENLIILTFAYDIDEDTVNDSSITVSETSGTKQPLVFDKVKVDGPVVALHYQEILVNTEYTVTVTKDILSIMGDPLDYQFQKTFMVTMDVDSTVEILSPADFEFVDQLTVDLKEIPGPTNKKLENRFRIQIASDYGFLNPLHETILTGKETITFARLKDTTQYFLRARVERDETAYGNWSKPVTFSIGSNPDKDPDKVQDDSGITKDDSEVIFEDSLEIVGYPENGVTPKSFLFEFDKDLDPSSIDINNIILTRKKV